jgi:hypothetical protein
MTGTASPGSPDHLESDSTSPRDLADLARAGYVVLRQPLMQVTFEVHHVVDRPGYLFDRVAKNPSVEISNTNYGFGETLTTSAYGLGLVVVTRTTIGLGSRRPYMTGGQAQCVRDDSGSRIFEGTARPNPSFIYESAWRFEGLISIDTLEKRIQKWHSRALREIVNEVSRLANSSRAPIISLQAPAQTPPSDAILRDIPPDREEDMLPPASSLAVRFSIALQRPSAATILSLSEQLARYCTNHGFGLWLADTRLGARTGNWFEICQSNRELSARPLSSQHEGSDHVMRCLPITLVGPARVGSTYAITSFLSQYKEIGIVACSVTSLDDLAFIHMELSFDDASTELLPDIDSRFNEKGSSAVVPDDLNRMLNILSYDRIDDHERGGLLVSKAGDYQLLVGPSRDVLPEGGERRMAVWCSWQAQGPDIDLTIPLNGLYAAFADVGLLTKTDRNINWKVRAPNIDYLVCRDMGNSILRGKGKLSMEKDPALKRYRYDGPEPRPTDLCVSIEEAWRARTAIDGSRGIGELTVAWRECWLGHWSSQI